jgi:putative peptidoglycan lipid II flippase
MHGPWLRPVLATTLVVTALVVAFLLFDHTDLGRQIFGQSSHAGATGPSTPDATSPPHIASVASFDPDGSGTPGENDAALPLAIDGNPATGWKTESYNDRHFGNLKPGVGLILTLTEATEVGTLVVTSPTQGWAAAVYESAAPSAPATLSEWGAPVDRRTSIAGNASFDLHGHTARHVLLWITDLGDGPPLVRAEIDELAVKS